MKTSIGKEATGTGGLTEAFSGERCYTVVIESLLHTFIKVQASDAETAIKRAVTDLKQGKGERVDFDHRVAEVSEDGEVAS